MTLIRAEQVAVGVGRVRSVAAILVGKEQRKPGQVMRSVAVQGAARSLWCCCTRTLYGIHLDLMDSLEPRGRHGEQPRRNRRCRHGWYRISSMRGQYAEQASIALDSRLANWVHRVLLDVADDVRP